MLGNSGVLKPSGSHRCSSRFGKEFVSQGKELHISKRGKFMTMVSTRRSSDVPEESHELSLRSRTVDVELRHSNNSQTVNGHDEYQTPRKRRKVGAGSDKSADLEGDSSREDAFVNILRPERNAEEVPGSPPTSIAAPSALILEDVTIVEDPEVVDAAPWTTTSKSHQGIVERGNATHKRFQSEEFESDIGKYTDLTAITTGFDATNAQTEVHNVSDDAADDEDAPETLSTNLTQSLPFSPAPKQTKSKKTKPRTPAPLNMPQEEPVPTSTNEDTLLNGRNDLKLSPLGSEAHQRPKRHYMVDAPASKRVKDIIKDGVTYRTVSREGLRSTSAWLPAKASQESKKRKEGLLVRKRVQKVNIGQRSKFIVSC